MPDRHRIRLAYWLQQIWQQHLDRFADLDYEWSLLSKRWERVQLTHRRWQLAKEQKWLLSLPRLQAEMLDALVDLADIVSIFRTAYQPITQHELPLSHWHQELVQLHDEFNKVTFQKAEGKLRVETPSITLAQVPLGAFAIDFKKEGLSPSIGDFYITALEPNPASINSDVIHPHVKDGELCAGDAKAPMKAALASGRLTDVFLIIQATIQTYNSQSAYVKLDQWNGVSCSDCSSTVDPEESYTCNRCGNTLCDHCFSSCSSCSSYFCPTCIRGCASCHVDCCEACLELSEGNGNPLCRDCRTNCDRCDRVVGKDELDGDSQLCQVCSDQEDEDLSEAQVTQEVPPL